MDGLRLWKAAGGTLRGRAPRLQGHQPICHVIGARVGHCHGDPGGGVNSVTSTTRGDGH